MKKKNGKNIKQDFHSNQDNNYLTLINPVQTIMKYLLVYMQWLTVSGVAKKLIFISNPLLRSSILQHLLLPFCGRETNTRTSKPSEMARFLSSSDLDVSKVGREGYGNRSPMPQCLHALKCPYIGKKETKFPIGCPSTL